jgi:adenine phosphoribosyltransferase
MELTSYIREIPDFPSTGILFRDITPLIGNTAAFEHTLVKMAEHTSTISFDKIAAIESRGFIFGAPLAKMLGKGFIPIRKKGKLPYQTVSTSYDLEYGSNTLEIHEDALGIGEKILIVDDVLATGGTANASARLIEVLGGEVSAFLFLIELSFLKGRKTLEGHTIFRLIEY